MGYSANLQLNKIFVWSLKRFRDYVNSRGRGGKVFVAVIEEGTVRTMGDRDRKFISNYLKKAELEERRNSMTWVPSKPLPLLPKPLKVMMGYLYYSEVKKCSSAVLHHFWNQGRKLEK